MMKPVKPVLVVLVVTCLAATVDANTEVKLIKSVLPFHEVMTPKWLSKHATIHGSYTYKPNYMEILAGVARQCILQVQLIPTGVLTSDDSQRVTVTMTVAMDTTWADSRDHDPSFGISNGERFIGFIIVDRTNFADSPPCYSNEGDNVNNILTNEVHDNSGLKPNSPRGFSSEVKIQIKPGENWGSCHTEHTKGFVLIKNYQRILTNEVHDNSGLKPNSPRGFSSEVKIQIKPGENWGSCHIEHTKGFVLIKNYQRSLDLTKGLFLDMYRNHGKEIYRIEYITVDVIMN